jgi:transporter family-2 protein
MKSSIIFATILGGVALALQAAWNARMRGVVGNPLLSAYLSVTVTFLFLSLAVVSGLGGRGTLTRIGTAPWWAWGGGFCGGYIVLTTLIAWPRIGAALSVACLVLGQMVTAMLLDSTGWFGMPRLEPSSGRFLGIALVVAGVALLQRR